MQPRGMPPGGMPPGLMPPEGGRRVEVFHCQATGCQREVPRSHLMCPDHWRMVPAHLRREVWAAWRTLCRWPSMHSSRAYQVVRRDAINAVEAKGLLRLARRTQESPQLF